MNLRCKNCGNADSTKFRWGGVLETTGEKRFRCKECGKWGNTGEEQIEGEYTYVNKGETAEITVETEDVIRTERDLISVLNINEDEWEIDRFVVGKSSGYRKDRRVEWEIEDGHVTRGSISDSGKLLIKPMFTVKVWLRRKTHEIRASLVVEDMIEKAKKFSPKYPKIKYKKHKDGLLYEIAMPDLQLGRLVLESETGKENSPDIAIARAESAVLDLLERVRGLPITRILFPIGNDFFNSNTAAMMTSHGTPQQDDVRWQRTFDLAQDFIVKVVDLMTTIAPVDILVIHGNHDEERIHYFGKVIAAWYHNNPQVKVDTSPNKRKYYLWKKNLIGLTHGYYEKIDKLSGLMAYEKPEWWAVSKNREWHLGDKHHKVDIVYKTEELQNGVVVRILRSLADPSVWEHDKGLVSSLKAAEGFVWHPERGVIDQKTSVPNRG